MRWVTLVLVVLTAWVAIAIAAAVGQPDRRAFEPAPVADRPAPKRQPERDPPRYEPAAKVPSATAVRAAAAYAAGREGTVSFALVNSEGKLLGRETSRLFSAASTVKAMLLAAELERLERDRLPLDAETDALLTAMITLSDNDAADEIYARVGGDGMLSVAARAGMTGFTEAGHWGTAQVSAADLARFFASLERLLAGPSREYALGLLGSVTAEQSWGIPAVAKPDWAVRFKGGWLPDRGLVHQAAELRDGVSRISIAVLTDAQPSFQYGTETVRGIAARLLSASGAG